VTFILYLAAPDKFDGTLLPLTTNPFEVIVPVTVKLPGTIAFVNALRISAADTFAAAVAEILPFASMVIF
jgi:hypothetical protein